MADPGASPARSGEPHGSPDTRALSPEGEDVNHLLREELVDCEERLRAVNRAWNSLNYDIQLLVYTADAPIIHPPQKSDPGKDPFLEAILRAVPPEHEAPKAWMPPDPLGVEILTEARCRETMEALSGLMDHIRGEEERNTRLSQVMRRAAGVPEELAAENARLHAALGAAQAEARRADASRRAAEARVALLEDQVAVQNKRLKELSKVAARASSRPIMHPYHHSPPHSGMHPRAEEAMQNLMRHSSWDGADLRHTLSRQITPPRGLGSAVKAPATVPPRDINNVSFSSAPGTGARPEVHRLSSIPRGMTIDELLSGEPRAASPQAGGPAPLLDRRASNAESSSGRNEGSAAGGAVTAVAKPGTFAAALFGQMSSGGGGKSGVGRAGAAREPAQPSQVTAVRQQRREAMQAASAALSGMPDAFPGEESGGGRDSNSSEQVAGPGVAWTTKRRLSGAEEQRVVVSSIHTYNRRVSGDLAPRMLAVEASHYRGPQQGRIPSRSISGSSPERAVDDTRSEASERVSGRFAHQEAAAMLGPALLRLASRTSVGSLEASEEGDADGGSNLDHPPRPRGSWASGAGGTRGSRRSSQENNDDASDAGVSDLRHSSLGSAKLDDDPGGSISRRGFRDSPGAPTRRGSGASLGGDSKKAWAASTSDVVARAVWQFQRRNSTKADKPGPLRHTSAHALLGGDGAVGKLDAGASFSSANELSSPMQVDVGGKVSVAPADTVSVEEAILKAAAAEGSDSGSDNEPLQRIAGRAPGCEAPPGSPLEAGSAAGERLDQVGSLPPFGPPLNAGPSTAMSASESFKNVFFSSKFDFNPDVEPPEGVDDQAARRRRLVRWLRKMPKVDVNRWLLTAAHPAALMEVAEEMQQEGAKGDHDIIEELNSAMMEEYLTETVGDMRPRTLAVIKRLWRDPVHICYLTQEAVAWAAADRVKHCEFRLNPMDMLGGADDGAAAKMKMRATKSIRLSISPRRLLDLVSSALLQASSRYALDTRMVVVLYDLTKPRAEQMITACMELSEMKTTKQADRPGGPNQQGSVVGVELRLETDKFGQSCIKLSRRLRVRIGDPWLTAQVARLKSAGVKITVLADAHCSGATAQAAVMALGVSRMLQSSITFDTETDRETLDTLSDYSVVMEVPFNVQQYREQAPWERAKSALGAFRNLKTKKTQLQKLVPKPSSRPLTMNMDALRSYVKNSTWADHHDVHNMPSAVLDVKTSGVDVALQHRDNGLSVAVGLLHPCTSKITLTDAYAHLVVALEQQGAMSVVFSHVKRAIITAAEATFTAGSHKNRLVQMMSMCMGALTPRLVQRLMDSRDALDDIVADAVMLEFGDLSEDTLAEQGLDPTLLTRGGVPSSVIVAHMLDVDLAYAAPDMNLASYRATVYREIAADLPRMARSSLGAAIKRTSLLGGSIPGGSSAGVDVEDGPGPPGRSKSKRAEFISRSFSGQGAFGRDADRLELMSRGSVEAEPGSSRRGGGGSSNFWNRLAGTAAGGAKPGGSGAPSEDEDGGGGASQRSGGNDGDAAPAVGVAPGAAAPEGNGSDAGDAAGSEIESEEGAAGGAGASFGRSTSDASEIHITGITPRRGSTGQQGGRRGSGASVLEEVKEHAELSASPELPRSAEARERPGGLRRASTGGTGTGGSGKATTSLATGSSPEFGFSTPPALRKRVKISLADGLDGLDTFAPDDPLPSINTTAGDSLKGEQADTRAPGTPSVLVNPQGGGEEEVMTEEGKAAAFASMQATRRAGSLSSGRQMIRRQSSRYGSFARYNEEEEDSAPVAPPTHKEALIEKLEVVRGKGRSFLRRWTSVIRPESKGATYFSTFMGFVVVFRALTDPYIFAFVEGVPGPWSGWFVVVTTANLIYVGCMYTSFRLGFSTKDEEGRVRVVLGRKEIATHYLSTWFVVDLACVLVYYVALVLYPIRSENGSADWIEALPLLSLLRIGRLRQLEIPVRFKQTNVYVLSALFFWFFMQAHIIGCFWFFMQRQEDFMYDCICAEPKLPDPPKDILGTILGWGGMSPATRDPDFQVSACEDPLDACCGYICPDGSEPTAECKDAGLMQPFLVTVAPYRQYLASLYFGFNSVAAFGPASPPCTGPEILLSCLTVVVGLATFALIIGEIDTIVRSKNRVNIDYREKLEEVRRFVNNHRVPPHLSHRIFSFLEEGWRRNKGVDEEGILGELSFTLRRDMKQYLHKRSVIQVPMFRQCNEAFVDALCLHLRQGWCLEGEILIHQGSVGREMYFLQRGVAEVGDSDFTTLYATLKDGSYFGEVALLSADMKMEDDEEDVPANSNFLPGLRTASVRAKTYCEFYILLKEALWDLLPSYPREHKLIKEAARQKVLQGRSLEHERQRRSNAACVIQNWWRRYTVLLWLDGPNGASAF